MKPNSGVWSGGFALGLLSQFPLGCEGGARSPLRAAAGRGLPTLPIRLQTGIAVCLAICLFDLYTSHRYGFHLNEVASIAEDGSPIDWPTGERPWFTLVPLIIYALGFMVAAATVQAYRLGRRCHYDGRIYRGAE